jgi:hypothetical protein
MTKKDSTAPKHSRRKELSLYPLKFDEVISDVLKVKPEPKKKRQKSKRQASKPKKWR